SVAASLREAQRGDLSKLYAARLTETRLQKSPQLFFLLTPSKLLVPLSVPMQSFQFHPAVAQWFEQTFGSPTEPQMRGWPAIQSGRHALISAPTGSGKTLAAFLASLDALFRRGAGDHLPDETQVVYVSPLKAL